MLYIHVYTTIIIAPAHSINFTATFPNSLPQRSLDMRVTSTIYLHYVDLLVYSDKTGQSRQIPGLSGDDGVVTPLIWYFDYLYEQRSPATLQKIREAFRLFYAYTSANHPGPSFGCRDKTTDKPWQHFIRFRRAVVSGSISPESQTDPSGLAWRPSSVRKVNNVITHLTDFFVWAEELGGFSAERLNPRVSLDHYAKLVQQATYEYRRGKAFLGHAWSAEPTSIARAVRGMRNLRQSSSEPPRFPDIHFERLLKEGFTTRSGSNLRDVLITILLNKGGLRESEVMHLWVIDVTQDPITGGALVKVRHPSQGEAPRKNGKKEYSNREDYLSQKYRMLPRNMARGRLHAGWKSSEVVLEVNWFEQVWGQHFWNLWKRYLQMLVQIPRNHPFAFIVMAGETSGRPLPIDAYYDAHTSAVYRAGLVPTEATTSLKGLGLTAHGHRHAYGHRAKNCAGIHEALVQDMMHHASPESQKIYTKLTRHEKMQALKDASARLNPGDKWIRSAVLAI